MTVSATVTYLQVAYRIGGTERCKWRLVCDRYATRADAHVMVDQLDRMGYKAVVLPLGASLPVGWDGRSVNWERDVVVMGEDETHWERKGG